MKRIVKMTMILVTVAAVALAMLGTALAQGSGVPTQEVHGVITAIVIPAATSTPPTVTIKPDKGADVTVKVVAKTMITKAGIGKATLGDLAVDDRATATYDKDTFEASKISVSQPLAKHHGYTGTIKSLTATSLVLTPKKGSDIPITLNVQTKYHVPGVKDASLGNFKAGDKVAVLAVDLKTGLTALHVNLIPSKPAHVQRVGTINACVPSNCASPLTSITVKDKKGDLSTFEVTSDTKIQFKQGATAVTPGDQYRATVVARRNPATDQYTATQILVFGPKS